MNNIEWLTELYGEGWQNELVAEKLDQLDAQSERIRLLLVELADYKRMCEQLRNDNIDCELQLDHLYEVAAGESL